MQVDASADLLLLPAAIAAYMLICRMKLNMHFTGEFHFHVWHALHGPMAASALLTGEAHPSNWKTPCGVAQQINGTVNIQSVRCRKLHGYVYICMLLSVLDNVTILVIPASCAACIHIQCCLDIRSAYEGSKTTHTLSTRYTTSMA